MLKVVLVEDERMLLQGLLMTTPWQEYGCVVVAAACNAIEGMEAIRRLSPDIVITDIQMPQISGLEMIERMKETTDCAYIIISGYDEFEYAQQAIKLGVHGYLLKPIDDDELAQVLKDTAASVREKRKYKQVMQSLDNQTEGVTIGDLRWQPAGGKEQYLDQAFSIICDRCTEDLTLKAVADSLYISESYLGKLFRRKTNYTFMDILTIYRMKKAVELMRDGNKKIYEVAVLLGYKDARYFSNLFKKIVGITPTEFRSGSVISSSSMINKLL